MDLNQKIEELLAHNAEDFEVAKTIKEEIKTYLHSLDNVYQENPGKDFLVKHTKKIDLFIQAIYKYTLRVFFGRYMPMSNSLPITIAALGSYGREEMSIYSDIDIMIVYQDLKGYNIKPMVEQMLYLAWDAGLKLGHRAHELSDLLTSSRSDITIKTAMLESRYLIGSKILWMETGAELIKIKKDKPVDFIKAKIEEFEQRHQKYAITMEPNLKDGIGGLRDANTLFWIGQVTHNIERFKDFTPWLLNDEEFKEFRSALEFIYMARSALHLITKKKKDTLTLDSLSECARIMGFTDTKYKKAELRLSQKALHSMHTIHSTSRIFVKKLTSPYFFDQGNIPDLRAARIEKNLFLMNSCLYSSFHIQQKKIDEILSIMVAYDGIRYDDSFMYAAKYSHIPDKKSAKTKSLIKQLFFKQNTYNDMLLFYEAGVIDKLITPFKKITHLPQFDGYHTFAVDVHSIQTLYHLETIQDETIRTLFYALSEEEQAVLKLTALLHDCGKGRKQDHSIIGAKLFDVYANKLGFSQKAIALGITLIRYHTLLSTTALREDIHSQKVIFSFIEKIPDQKLLDMLYVLTYADVNAVGKNIYSSYNYRLLFDLYTNIKNSYGNEEVLSETSRRLRRENILKKKERFLALSKLEQKKLLSIESNLFFLMHKTDEILDIINWVNTSNSSIDYIIENETSLSIKIIRKERLNLGYLLAKLGLFNLIHMDIFKLYNEIKYFKIDFKLKAEVSDLIFIEEILQDAYDMEKRVKFTPPTIQSDELAIDCEHSKTYAKMTLDTVDQKGIMAHIVTIFDSFDIDIASAKIETSRKRVKNLFLIEKNGKFCHNREKILDLITCAES
jgi:[protein-PII] uridylyltransferase